MHWFFQFLYGSEIWTLEKKKDKKDWHQSRWIFFRKTALFDHKRNEEILEELEVEPVNEKLRRYEDTNQTGYDT